MRPRPQVGQEATTSGRPSQPDREQTDARPISWVMRDEHWSRCGLALSCLLLLASPAVRRRVPRDTFFVYLQLPVYMLHQYEEHGHSAFKRAAAAGQLPGMTGITDREIFWINILGVWGLDSAALGLSRATDRTLGLVAPFLALVNAVLHIVPALRTHRSNPGLWTAALLFLPFGGYSAFVIARETRAPRSATARGLGIAVLVHLVTVFSVRVGNRRHAPAQKSDRPTVG